MREERVFLEHEADRPFSGERKHLLNGRSNHVCSPQLIRPRSGPRQPGDSAENRRLPGPGGADERDRLLPDLER
jgi:hypothetical protein